MRNRKYAKACFLSFNQVHVRVGLRFAYGGYIENHMYVNKATLNLVELDGCFKVPLYENSSYLR